MSKNNRGAYRVWLNGHTYVEPKLLPSNIIELPPQYQRRIDLNHVQEIVDNFNRAILNPIKVSHRNGKYWAFDGGHSFTALKQINAEKKVFMVECRVYENLSFEEEAELFAFQSGSVRKVPIKYEMNALVLGKNKETMDLVAATEAAGFTLGITEHPEGSIEAIEKARLLYQKYGTELYTDALCLIKETWNGRKESLTANMMGGVMLFLSRYKDTYLRQRFVKKLSVQPLQELKRDARRNKGRDQSADGSYATAIARVYNYGGGKGRLDERLFWTLGVKRYEDIDLQS